MVSWPGYIIIKKIFPSKGLAWTCFDFWKSITYCQPPGDLWRAS
jgi:hypothetical protein